MSIDDSDERRRAAEEWAAASTELDSMLAARNSQPHGAVARIKSATTGWWVERRRAQRVAALDTARQDWVTRMTDDCAGAVSGEWGPLSGPGRRLAFSLETTLDRICRENPSPLAAAARNVAATLPRTRAHAELGEPGPVRDLEDAILDLIESPHVDSVGRRRLIEHLPGHRRPLAQTIDDLDRADLDSVELSVTYRGPDLPDAQWLKEPVVTLHFIKVAPDLRGLGLGTAVLQELLTFADHHNYPVVGELHAPDDRPERSRTALAAWYYRHGFRHGVTPPEEWENLTPMRREPQSGIADNR